MIVDTCRGVRFTSYDDAEQIACCLSCTLPDCRNCERVSQKRKTRSGTETLRSIARLHRAGKSNREIAAELGKSVETVRKYLSMAKNAEMEEPIGRANKPVSGQPGV